MNIINNKKDIRGIRFGRLTVLRDSDERTNKGCIIWVCLCICGNFKNVPSTYLLSGRTRSCGCLSKEHMRRLGRKKNNKTQIKHGWSKSRLYNVWRTMKHRCYNPNFYLYKYYGGRGITICEEWKNGFIEFKNWAIKNGYQEGLTIDRIDNEGEYNPQNCRWITLVENLKKNPRKRDETGRFASAENNT